MKDFTTIPGRKSILVRLIAIMLSLSIISAGIILIGISLKSVSATSNEIFITGLSYFSLITAFACGLTFFFARGFTEPIMQLVKGTKAISRGDFGTKVEIKTGDEIEGLGDAFNKMAEQLKMTGERKMKLKDSAIETSINAVVMCDMEGKLTYVNPSFMKMWGYENNENVLGQPFAKFGVKNEKGEIKMRTLQEEGNWAGEVIVKRKDGSEFNAQVSASLVKDEEGGPIQIMAFFVDITERKKMEEKLLNAKRLATIGEFSSGIAHELRQPFGVISNSAYFLSMKLKDVADEKVNRHLAILDKEVKRANRLIADLLDFARVPTPTLKECDINQIVEEALSRVDIPANVELKKEIKRDLPMIKGDFDQLQRACLNIIVNAVSAMPNGGSLAIETGMENDGKDIVIISILDTGEGIPKENIEKVFEPLFTTKARGIGLGLSLSKKYVEAHGGQIEVESEVGKAAAFTVKLPISG